ncbi:MAG: hypothetical protein ABR992_20465 [Solirubrobacteraceae bacterium]|jgi:hypothetical protein
MDDVRRNALVATGTVFMGGAITWVVAVSFAPGHSASVRVFVPVLMFIVGAVLVIWAIRSKPHAQRAALILSGTLEPDETVREQHRRPDEPSASDGELIGTLRTLCNDIDAFIEQEATLGIPSYGGYVKRELMVRYQGAGLQTRMFWVANQLLDRGFIEPKQRDRLQWEPINPKALEGKRDTLLGIAQLMGGP